MSHGRSLSTEESDRVRAELRSLVAEHGSQKALAPRLGVSQQTISHVLAGKNAGYALARAVAHARRIHHVDAWLAGRAADPPDRAPVLGGIPEWAELEPEARRLFSHVPPWAFDAVRQLRGENLPERATVLMIGQLAAAWSHNASHAQRAAAIRDRAEREMDAIDTHTRLAARSATAANDPSPAANDAARRNPRARKPRRPRARGTR